MLTKLLQPRFPSCAVGIESGIASVVQLERGAADLSSTCGFGQLAHGFDAREFRRNNIGDPASYQRAFRI